MKKQKVASMTFDGNAQKNQGFLYTAVGFLAGALLITSIAPGGSSESLAEEVSGEAVSVNATSENNSETQEASANEGASPAPYSQSPAFGPVTIEDRLKALETQQTQKVSDIVTVAPDVGSVSGFPIEYEEKAVQIAADIRESIVYVTGMKVNSGIGTGWVVAPNMIVTNEHVANHDEEYYGQIAIRTIDGEIIPGAVVYEDAYRDIAMIELERDVDKPALEIVDSLVDVGETVVAVGHPGRIGNWAAMAGVVTDNNYYDGESILTSLPISTGASGSPIMNMDGKVVGIVSGIYYGAEDPSLDPAPDEIVVHTFLPRINNAGGSNHIMLKEMLDQLGIDY
jgi:S1-C subfamily serine protease